MLGAQFVPGCLQFVVGELLLGAGWVWGKPPGRGHIPAARWAEVPGKEPWQGQSGNPGPRCALSAGDGTSPEGSAGPPACCTGGHAPGTPMGHGDALAYCLWVWGAAAWGEQAGHGAGSPPVDP